MARQTDPRPSELVPWADPYIAGLINKLQAEVRSERAAHQPHDAKEIDVELTAWEFESQDLVSEADIPWIDEPFEYDPRDGEMVPDFDDRRGADLPATGGCSTG